MANRHFSQNVLTMNRGTVILSGYFSLAADASVSSTATTLANTFPGVLSVAKASTGTYTVTLQDKYVKRLAAHANLEDGATALDAKVSATDVSAATPTITIKTLSSANAAVDTTATATVCVTLVLRNSKGNKGE
jgi:hypothetical protein